MINCIKFLNSPRRAIINQTSSPLKQKDFSMINGKNIFVIPVIFLPGLSGIEIEMD